MQSESKRFDLIWFDWFRKGFETQDPPRVRNQVKQKAFARTRKKTFAQIGHQREMEKEVETKTSIKKSNDRFAFAVMPSLARVHVLSVCWCVFDFVA